MNKWRENISKARIFVENKRKNQMLVAGLAMEVCEITWGGSKLNRSKYTLKKFSEEIGMSDRLLSSWVNVRRNVYDKLSKDAVENVSYTNLAQVALRVSRKDSPTKVKQMFDTIIGRDNFDTKVIRYIADLRAIAYNYEYMKAGKNLPVKTQEEIVFYCQQILSRVHEEHPNIKGKDHNLASVSNIRNLAAAQAFGVKRKHLGSFSFNVDDDGKRMKITPKDRDIVLYMQKHPRFHSPTEIGMKLGGHNANSASAWACRTLNKLIKVKQAERNTKGQYRLI